MNEKGYRRFKLLFHTFILVFAIGVISASIAGWSDMDRAPLYLFLGVLFSVESLSGLYRGLWHRTGT